MEIDVFINYYQNKIVHYFEQELYGHWPDLRHGAIISSRSDRIHVMCLLKPERPTSN